ncbi:hypothetical protein [Thioalkalivibrio paradoxus]|uniref:Phosphoribosyl-AMP cyclohydrolase n=1 Tax=Thioalkalivibrio paradoxus ARh 1 TaxID=713585 RepID=W0DKN3_9GAMM|nr:hypothetical protein [Thioalkalivibrio paradoxus]AHE97563.1 hypothetical protein THITH_04005 [Thioalkalivibrio paradoxus ARh 1]
MKLKYLLAAAVLTVCTGHVAAQGVVVNQTVSEQEILAAQQGWCTALLDIGAAYQQDGHTAAQSLADAVIDAAYAYQMGAVLFKPTLTVNPQTFRTTREGALSYFVGGNESFPKDTGFALKGWTECVAENAAIFIAGNTATTMGKVHFTDSDGKVTSVDKTWGYVMDDTGALRIMLHHSSLEYQGG